MGPYVFNELIHEDNRKTGKLLQDALPELKQVRIHLHSIHAIFHDVIANHNYVRHGSSAGRKILYT